MLHRRSTPTVPAGGEPLHPIYVCLLALLSLLGHQSDHTPRTTPPRATRSAARSQPDWEALKRCESGGRYNTDTGNGYYGAYQFDRRTWRSVGGTGNPAHASPAEQDMRAQLLYSRRGRAPWPHCGRYL